MVNGPRRLQEHVSRVQSSLAVTTVVHKKLLPIFRKVFVPPKEDETKGTTIEQFTSEDLMNTFHLLLCTLDFIFQDLRSSELKYLLDSEFVNDVGMQGDEESVLEIMCQKFEGVILDAKHFRTHCWIPRLRKMMSDGTIKATAHLTRFVANARTNLENLNKMYDEIMVKRGEMDERMFLPKNITTVFDEAFDAAAIERLRRTEGDEAWEVDAELLLRMSTQTCLEKLQDHKKQRTPLTGRGYIISGDQLQLCPVTPLSSSIYNANKLEKLIQDGPIKLEGEIEMIMSQSRSHAALNILNLVQQLACMLDRTIATEREKKGVDFDGPFTDMFATRKDKVEMLFYRFLGKIAVAEKERMGNSKIFELSAVLNRDDFLCSLYACALQLVIFTYESKREFPWCLKALRLQAIHFYKVIELVIRADPELSREMVKHLNKVEERVLEELAWSLDSPLWHSLNLRADGVPSSQSVSLGSIEAYSSRVSSSVTLSQRYMQSPIKQGTAKRRLDFDDDGPHTKRKVVDHEGSSLSSITSATTLFFRKVYYLATVRLQDLCERVRLDDKGRQRAWTLFEHLLRTETSLMAGRHLDQNLMCCIYVVAKIGQQNISFHDIMYHYRHQPQASSRVYRRVLIEPATSLVTVSADNTTRDASTSKNRTAVSKTNDSTPTSKTQNVEYTDLIKYYNSIFVSRVEYFVKKLQPATSESNENIVSLLAIPHVQCNKLSPQRTISDHLTVLPMPSGPVSISQPLRYSFNRSPSKDLKSINTMLHNAGRSMLSAGIGNQHALYRNLSTRSVS